MKAISLCSGADGFGYAAKLLGIEVVAHVEIETVFDEHYKRHWAHAQRFYDITTLNPEEIADADIIFGGEPCQGNSVAGKREGKKDYRYLWPHYFRICKAKRPTWIINENVTGSISNLVLDAKVADLESIGYTCRIFNLPAVAVGADHERKRIFLVAHADGQHGNGERPSNKNAQPHKRISKAVLAQVQQRSGLSRKRQLVRGVSGRIFAAPVSGIYAPSHDVPTELAEIKAYGNAIVPWIPYVILKFILQIETNNL